MLSTVFVLLLSASGYAKTIIVDPMTPTTAVTGWVEGGLSGCSPGPQTSGTVTMGPFQGSVSFMSVSVTQPNCPGVIFPGTAAIYEWTTTTGVSGVGVDAFHVQFTAPGFAPVDADVTVFEFASTKDLGKQPPRPCKGCEATGGEPSVPPDAPSTGDEVPPTSSDVSTDGRSAVGAPIDIASGNVFYEHTDYTTAGANRLSFTRYYNSLASITSPVMTFSGMQAVNRNWRSNFDRHIDLLTSNVVVVERPDGRAFSFFLVGGVWTPDTDVDYTLTQSGSTWTLTTPDDTVETYAAGIIPTEVLSQGATTGNIVEFPSASVTSIVARNGYTQTLTYANTGVLDSVTDSYGRTLTFTHNSDETLASVTTPDGTTISYGYGVPPVINLLFLGAQLTTVTFPTTPAQTLTYSYGDSSLPFALTSVIDEDGNTFQSWTYNSAGQGLTSSSGGTLGANLTTLSYGSGTTTVTNALGVTDIYSFTTLQNVPKVTGISRAATTTTAAATRTLTYDGNGYMASQTDWNGNTTSYTNNAHGLPTSLTEGVGSAVQRTVSIAYDPTFVHLPGTITAAGVTRGYVYDGSGNPLTVTLTDTTTTTSPYATAGQTRTWTNTWSDFLLASTKTPNGNLTQFTYDTSGALTQITDPLGHVTNITKHTGGGLPETVVDPNNVTTTLTYDPRQRLTASAVATSAGTLTTGFAYDPAGNLTQMTLPDGSFIAHGYDAAHRITGTTDALGNSIAYGLDALGDPTSVKVYDATNTLKRQHSGTFDALGRLLVDTAGAGQKTTLTYDAQGNALTVTDGLSHTTTRTFDALNRLATSTDANGGVTTPTYDAFDRLIALEDANGNSTSYVIDGFGEVIGQTSADTGSTTYTFDSDGNLTKKVDAAGVTVNMTYDGLDRLLTRSFPADETQNATYAYDATAGADAGASATGFLIGRLASRADASGTTAFTYDERGNALTATVSGAPNGANLSTSYVYDKASRIASVTYPSGLAVSYGHDAQGNVSAVTATPPGATAATTLATLAYLPFGQDSSATLGNGVAEDRTYDLDYRLTHITATGTAGALQDLTYTIDNANNVGVIADAVNAANGQTLTYDVINRLTGAVSGTGGYGTLAWAYDKVGNLTSRTAAGATTTYGYTTGSNRLAGITAGTTITTIATNANGNITSIPPANATAPATFAYNVANRLASVSGSPTAATYSYDDWGRRVSKTAGGNTTTFAHGLAGALLEEVTGTALTDYIYVNGRPFAAYEPQPSTTTASAAGPPALRPDAPRNNSALGTKWALALGIRSGSGSSLLLFVGLFLVVVAGLGARKRRAALLLMPLALGLMVFGACGSGGQPGGSGGSGGHGTGGGAAAGSGGQTGGTNGGAGAQAGGNGGGGQALGGNAGVGIGGNGGGGQTGGSGGAAGSAGTGQTTGGNGGAGGVPPQGGNSGTVGAGGQGGAAGAGGQSGSISAFYYLHTDHLGTPQLATDDNQTVVWSTTYQPYGTTGAVTGTITQNLRLPGQYFDAETGFSQNGFRDYMPGVGRYLEADFVGLSGGPDLYSYANGTPDQNIDASGLTSQNWFYGTPDQNHSSYGQMYDPLDTYTILGHGKPEHFCGGYPCDSPGAQDISASDMAKKIYNDPNYWPGMPVEVIACNSGVGDNSYAQQLANELGRLALLAGHRDFSAVYGANGFVVTPSVGYFPLPPIVVDWWRIGSFVPFSYSPVRN